MALERSGAASDAGHDRVGGGEPGCFGEAVGGVDGGGFGTVGFVVLADFGGFVDWVSRKGKEGEGKVLSFCCLLFVVVVVFVGGEGKREILTPTEQDIPSQTRSRSSPGTP